MRALAEPATRVLAAASSIADVPARHVPVGADGWLRSREDAQLDRALGQACSAITAVAEVYAADGTAIARTLRPLAVDLAGAVDRLAKAVIDLSPLMPGARAATDANAECAALAKQIEDVGAWMRAGAPGDPPNLGPARSAGRTDIDHDDPLTALFGELARGARDATGAPSASRLLALWRNQLSDLQRRMDAVLEPLAGGSADIFATLQPLLDTLDVRRPLPAWQTAMATVSLIQDAARRDPDRLRDVCLGLREREAQRAASRKAISHAGDANASSADRALSALSIYRRLVEGQVRDWAGAAAPSR